MSETFLENLVTFDAHQDISDAILYAHQCDFFRESGLHEGTAVASFPVNNQLDYIRLQKANFKASLGVTCVVGFAEDGSVVEHENYLREVLRHLNVYYDIVRRAHGEIGLIKTKQDLENWQEKTFNIMLALEGINQVDENLQILETVYNLGVRSIGLAHIIQNELCGTTAQPAPLTKLGERFIKRMGELSIILDLSHIAHEAFDAAVACAKPGALMVSHTGCRAIYDHHRNISDAQMKAVVAKGGVIGICGSPKFVCPNHTVEEIVTHIQHAIVLVGEDNVILGTDFAGMTDKVLPKNFAQVTDIKNLYRAMLTAGISEAQIEKIAHKNIWQFLHKNLPNNL